jgi:hypothetical protein
MEDKVNVKQGRVKNCSIRNTRRKHFAELCIYSGVILNRKVNDNGVVLCTGLYVFVFSINRFINQTLYCPTNAHKLYLIVKLLKQLEL